MFCMNQSVKCLRCSSLMEETLTRKGVLIDICSSCKGVWLDQGELNFFVQNKKILNHYETKGLEASHKIVEKCPKCQSQMQVGRMPGFPHQVEECLSCRGIFFDAHEFKKLQATKEFKTIRRDYSVSTNRTSRPKPKASPSLPLKIPSLTFTTGVVCLSLYGFLFALIVFSMETMKISTLFGSALFVFIVAIQFYISPFLLDWQLKLMGSLQWVTLDRVPPYFKKSLLRLCAENRIPIPKVGIIHDSSPQAYTYGRTPRSARLVFSRGMFELLDEEEVEAVLAHELGHIKHWDFVVMTVIKLVPFLLYIIYRNIRIQLQKRKNKKGKGPLAVAMVVSYIAYLLSDYMVLFVSRVREYYADQFSCFATKKPNKLLTALIKVSYGLLGSRTLSDSEDESHEDKVKGVEALNITSISRSKQLALASQGEGNQFNPKVIQEIMRWDLWSPWASYYELHSTHPLTAKRINAIGTYALSLKQEPYLLFNKEKPESYWDDFFGDVLVLLLPYILFFGGVLTSLWFTGLNFNISDTMGQDPLSTTGKDLLPHFGAGGALKETLLAAAVPGIFAGVLGLSLGAFIRLLKTYPSGRFFHYSVASLLKLIKVSPVRSYPVTLKGHILGRGEAGNIFSEDFVLRDQTGIIYLNHEPFGLNILFALFRYKKFQGKEVKVTGWYRRSPSPYVEVKNIRTFDTKSMAYTYYYKMVFCLIGLAIPAIYFSLI